MQQALQRARFALLVYCSAVMCPAGVRQFYSEIQKSQLRFGCLQASLGRAHSSKLRRPRQMPLTRRDVLAGSMAALPNYLISPESVLATSNEVGPSSDGKAPVVESTDGAVRGSLRNRRARVCGLTHRATLFEQCDERYGCGRLPRIAS